MSTEVHISRDTRVQHLYVSGLSGFGKTTLLHHMALDDMEQDYGLTILDPKGGLVEQIINHIPPHRLNDVVYLDGISEVPLDLLRWVTNLERSNLADDLMVIFERFSQSSAGDQWLSIMQWTVLTILEARGSFLDIYYFLTDDSEKAKILERVKNEDIKKYWARGGQCEKLKGHSENSIITRMAKFLLDPSIKAMLGTSTAKLHIPTLIADNKIILVNLAKVGERAGNIIGTLLISQIQQAVFKRIPEHYGYPYYLYVDEFQDFKSPAFAQILRKARGFGLGLTLVSLHPKLLGDLIEDVKGCITSYVFFKTDAEHANPLKAKFSPFRPDDLWNLKPFEAIYRGEDPVAQLIHTDLPPDDPTLEQLDRAEFIRRNTINNYAVSSAQNCQKRNSESPSCDTEKDVLSLKHAAASHEKPDPSPTGTEKPIPPHKG